MNIQSAISSTEKKSKVHKQKNNLLKNVNKEKGNPNKTLLRTSTDSSETQENYSLIERLRDLLFRNSHNRYNDYDTLNRYNRYNGTLDRYDRYNDHDTLDRFSGHDSMIDDTGLNMNDTRLNINGRLNMNDTGLNINDGRLNKLMTSPKTVYLVVKDTIQSTDTTASIKKY